MKVGFTGTRKGLTNRQWASLANLLNEQKDWAEFHHGDCVGADDDAAVILSQYLNYTLLGAAIRIVRHPPLNSAAWADNDFCHETRPPAAYLVRNQNIVDASDLLVACPDGPEQQRSGTWSTVRYARRTGKPIIILWPDGRVTRE